MSLQFKKLMETKQANELAGWCTDAEKLPILSSFVRGIRQDFAAVEEAFRSYQMIAISTDAPEGLKASYDKNELTYTLFSDADVPAGRAFGLAFKAPAGYKRDAGQEQQRQKRGQAAARPGGVCAGHERGYQVRTSNSASPAKC